jgi:ABC-2 type transport system permease protein
MSTITVDTVQPMHIGVTTTGYGTAAIERPAGMVATTLAVAGRTLKKFVRSPQLVVLGTIQGAMFLLIFRYVFGGNMAPGAVPYVDYLVPGFVAGGLLFSGMTTATGVAEDVEQGFFDRLRSMPVPRSALVAGRAVADTVILTWSTLFTIAVGYAVGFRPDGDPGQLLAAVGLCVVFGFAFIWLFVLLGLLAGTAQGAQGVAMLVFPLSFVSSAYVPVDSMPGWLQPIAENQPLTVMTNAIRSLALGDPALAGLSHSTAHWVLLSLAWSFGLVAVFAPLAVARYRRTG